jgi:hypothetical protein
VDECKPLGGGAAAAEGAVTAGLVLPHLSEAALRTPVSLAALGPAALPPSPALLHRAGIN